MAVPVAKNHSVLFVCFGNTCRSTMAEVIFLHLLSERGELDKWKVDSAAISDYNVGLAPNPRTVSTLQKNGISLDGYHHIARLLTDEDYRQFDIIFGMDEYNIMDLQEYQPSGRRYRADIQLLGDWDPQGERIIRDPVFTRGTDAFDKVFEQCMRSLAAFLNTHQQ
ncbi:low molecular weight phosphotyrosine protein phosphatase-like [Babylonia areolata]|uniref:low molecular weight phosphotyrosine protein phosphatase-like n=1 Tax=Babylonia areolata TaxID=304850 RepID=UPI003FCF69A4